MACINYGVAFYDICYLNITTRYIVTYVSEYFNVYCCNHTPVLDDNSVGVDEQTIIDVLTKRTYAQRREIAFSYERKAKKVLILLQIITSQAIHIFIIQWVILLLCL